MNDETPIKRSSRSGGRSARHAARTAALPDNMRPVRAGMTGGTYKPLSETDVLKIHEAALTALETIGLADAPPSGVEILTGAGAILGDDGRIRFPRALVEDMLAISCKDLTLCARDPAYDLDLSGQRVHYGTAGAAVNLVNVLGNSYRDSTVQDIHDAARIVDVLDNIHFLQRPMVARDILDNLEMDINTLYACLSVQQSMLAPRSLTQATSRPASNFYTRPQWRSEIQIPPVCFNVELFRRPPDEVCHRILRSHGNSDPWRDACLIAVRGHVWRDGPVHDCRCDCSGGSRMPCGRCLR